MRNNKTIEQVEMAAREIPLPSLDVKISLTNHPAIAQVLECIADNKGFGLQCPGSTIIFDPVELVVYDYSDGQLNKTICGTNTNFINYLKLAAVNHRTFISSEKCIEIVGRKNTAPRIEIVEK